MLTLTDKKIHRGSLILVNEQYGTGSEPEDLLMPACDRVPEVMLLRCAAALLNELMQEIHGWDHIVPVSGYRPLAEQQQIWDDSLLENGECFTRKYVALPGHSEHQTGLAIDLALKQENIDFIHPDFPYSGICQTFREKAPKYGFILRYPEGKEKITGIGHEPWHFRYVGTPHARIMTDEGLTLEEYMDFIRQFPYGGRPYLTKSGSRKVRISYLSAARETDASGNLLRTLAGHTPCTVSGNNIDGYIITEYLRRL